MTHVEITVYRHVAFRRYLPTMITRPQKLHAQGEPRALDLQQLVYIIPRKYLRKKIWTTVLIGLFCALPVISASLVPADRLVDWTPGVAVGVPGGIPTNRSKLVDVTKAPYNADNTGQTNASPAIQSAVNAASLGEIVYLPPGVYRIETTIYIGDGRDGITVRGAGIDQTIIDVRTNVAFYVGTGSDYQWQWPGTGNNVVSTLVKGSTSVSLPDTAEFAPGQIISIQFENQTSMSALRSGSTLTFSTSGYTNLRRQLTQVISKTGSTLKISPSVAFTPDAGLGATVAVAQRQTDSVGIEDMTLDASNFAVTNPIVMEQCFGSWIKGIKILNTSNFGISISNSLKCEIRGCFVNERKGGGSNGAGILMGTVSASLFEDNIILKIFPAIEVNSSSMGNVIAYNVMENSVGGTLNTNHGPHNSFNLYEGNITPNIQSDGYFGSASDDTFFRNWIHGTNATKTLRTFMVSLNRFTRNYSFAGNILGESGTVGTTPYSFGNPNMGNSAFTNTAKTSAGTFWRDWNSTGRLSARTSNSSGTIDLNSGGAIIGQWICFRWENSTNLHSAYVSSVSGNKVSWTAGSGTTLPPEGTEVRVFFGSAGYQESDLDVERTTIVKGNYFFGTKSIPTEESIGFETLPASLFRSAKPDWFGDMQWPPFDPTNPASASFASIPAGYRYLNGVSSPPVSPVASSIPTNVRVKIQQ